MKNLMPRMTPAARIALGLISLVVTLLLITDIALGLVPDKTEMQRKIRESTSERLAILVTSLIQNNEWDTLKLTVQQTVARDPDILSVAVRQQDGRILVRFGDHRRYWVAPAPGQSTLTHVRVPIYTQNTLWGDVEISYKPVTPQTLKDWIHTPLIALALIIVPVGFLAFYLYMRRALQYIDPAAAIPDRVRTAFDALTEGVVVIDRSNRIMLFNKAFRQFHPEASQELLGKDLSQIPWLNNDLDDSDKPWESIKSNHTHNEERLFSITQPDQSVFKVVVKAAPINDTKGKLRGGIVTFYNVTALQLANENMRKTMAELVATREQIEQKNYELIRLASRDSLTGCLNRRALYENGEPMFTKHLQEARDMSCIMADIDFFKQVNDKYGHQVGDQVIVGVANAFSQHVRNVDLLCRYGGEEFCILMPGSSEEAAFSLAEQVRLTIQNQVGQGIPSQKEMLVTSSFGVASLKSGAGSLSELIELADFALYSSKRNGKNMVTIWSDKMPQITEDNKSVKME